MPRVTLAGVTSQVARAGTPGEVGKVGRVGSVGTVGSVGIVGRVPLGVAVGAIATFASELLVEGPKTRLSRSINRSNSAGRR